MISSDEAKSALDYSMSRFEVHIDTDFGDGLWAEWLETNGDSDYGISGYLWSALGSPFRKPVGMLYTPYIGLQILDMKRYLSIFQMARL